MTSCILAAALVAAPPTAPAHDHRDGAVRMTQAVWVDQARNREVPVAIYAGPHTPDRPMKPAIISHGYGGRNTDYSFIAESLAIAGYYVVSIQHEIPGDAPLPSEGKPYDVRMPSWQRGVENICFAIGEMKKVRPDLDFTRLVLVGHSHGGDTSMLFAREHPTLARAVISLDNRRMPVPRAAQPRMLTLRSSDLPADEGVLPSEAEQAQLGIRVVRLPATIHNDMWDGATERQRAEMLAHITRFLRDSGN